MLYIAKTWCDIRNREYTLDLGCTFELRTSSLYRDAMDVHAQVQYCSVCTQDGIACKPQHRASEHGDRWLVYHTLQTCTCFKVCHMYGEPYVTCQSPPVLLLEHKAPDNLHLDTILEPVSSILRSCVLIPFECYQHVLLLGGIAW